jgi:YD repeat-containing protein
MLATRWLTLTLVLLPVFSLPVSVCAQSFHDPNRKIAAPGTVSHVDMDSVSMANGNLSLKIPLLSLPGRGLDTDISLTFNSKLWKTDVYWEFYNGAWHAQIQTNLEADVENLGPFVPFLGWRLGIARMGNFATGWNDCTDYVQEIGVCGAGYVHRTWTQNDGTRTNLSGETVYTFYGPNPGQWSPNVLNNRFPGWSYDGSYIRGDMPYQVLGPHSSFVRYKDGVTATFDLLTPGAGGQYTATLRDTNGNRITCTKTSCVDTLNRTINFNYSSDLLQSLTYLDSNGDLQTITFSYEMRTVTYPWGNYSPQAWYEPVGYAGSYYIPLLTQVTLPNGHKFQIFYVPNGDGTTTGEVERIVFPTGGYIRYGYGWTIGTSQMNEVLDGQRRAVALRAVSSDGTPQGERVWFYAIGTAREYLGLQSIEQNHLFDPSGGVQTFHNVMGLGMPILVESKDSAGNVLRSKIQTIGFDAGTYYNAREHLEGPGYIQTYKVAPSNPRTLSTVSVLSDTDQRAREELAYDSYGNVTERKEFNWGNGSWGPLARRTVTSYLHNANTLYRDRTIHILNRITLQQVYDSAGNTCGGAPQPCAQTANDYDVYTYSDMGPMQPTGAVGHDNTNYLSSFIYRGNVTATKRWRNTEGVWLESRYQYDDAGSILKSRDPLSHHTTFGYSDNWANSFCAPPGPAKAYLTSVTNALGHVTTYSYNSCTGTLASVNDPNSQVTTTNYDFMNRPDVTTFPDGGRTDLDYDDDNRIVTAQKKRSSSPLTFVVNRSHFDGLGRLWRTESCEDGTVGCAQSINTYTEFDSLGRVSRVTNPTRCQSSVFPEACPAESTFGVTKTKYDALGRPTRVIPPDGNEATDANVIKTAYSGNSTTVTDQAGKQRRSFSDALGRLIQVDEPSATSATSGTGAATISGSEQSTGGTGPTPGTGTVTIEGSEQSGWQEVQTWGCILWDWGGYCIEEGWITEWQEVYDTGVVAITVNGVTKSA